MIEALLPPDEAERLDALRRLGLLDAPPSDRFDRITRIGREALRVPIALVTLIDANRQWFASCLGLDLRETPRSVSFCAHTILEEGPLIIRDAAADPRFADNPLVSGPPHIRFYAGIPLRTTDGYGVGTFCAIDVVPRSLDDFDLGNLVDLATWAEHELNADELSRALRERRRSEQRLAAVLDAVADGIATFDADGRILSLNRAAERMFGLRTADLAGLGVDTLLVDGRSAAAALVRSFGSPENPPVHTVVGRRADGSPFPMEVTLSTTDSPDGRIWVVAARDLSERRAAQAALAGLQLRYDLVLESADEGVAVLDRDGCVAHVNPAAARLLGAEGTADVVGRSFHDTFHRSSAGAAGHPPEACPAHLAMVGCRAHRSEEVLVGASGREITVEQSAAPLVTDGLVTGAVVTLTDVTERRAVERLKDEFVSVVSHELRTPLTSIRGSLGLLAGGVVGEVPPQAREMVDIALASTERLIRLVNDILDLERLRSGHSPTRPAAASLREVIDETVAGVQPMADAADVALRAEVEDAVVVVDRDRVVQAVTNLLGNAVKFSPASAEVTVAATLIEPASGGEGQVVIEVRDRGRGIPEDAIHRLFEPFQQVDSSDARLHGGTGLGLAIVRTIAQAHGGTVEVQSEVGAGSTFTVRLPQPPATAPAATRAAAAGG